MWVRSSYFESGNGFEKNEDACRERKSPEWPYSPQKIVEMLDKVSLPTIYKTIAYTFYGKLVTNKYIYAKTESSQLSTRILSMTCD